MRKVTIIYRFYRFLIFVNNERRITGIRIHASAYDVVV